MAGVRRPARSGRRNRFLGLRDGERGQPTNSRPCWRCWPIACRCSCPGPLQALRRTWQSRPPRTEENTPTGARDNIHRHYDLSNDLFKLFLDPSLTYSAAWFEPGDDLAAAQLRKIDAILDLARVRPGMRVLEIGSGWGALAMRAARTRDVHVTTLTLSEAQRELAIRRIAAAGLSQRIDVLLEDYRQHAAREAGQLRRGGQRGDDRGGR